MDLRNELETIIPSNRILTRPIERYAYAHDASVYRLIPQAVVQPIDTTEVQKLFSFSHTQRIPIVFRAGGTSLSGQAITDGILVDVSKHWIGHSILDEGARVLLQPGIIGADANLILKTYNRRIGPDPASIDAAMIGGILSNNSSGMCCGIVENAYRTIHSLKMVFTNGLLLDTSHPEASQHFREGAPEIATGLLEIRKKILAHPDLQQKIGHKYQTKNTTGYSLNAFLDFSEPIDILQHLMIGSEGTLGFIASAVLNTLPVYPYKYTGLLFFPTVQDACDALVPLTASGARAIEIMDRASLRSVEGQAGMPAALQGLPETAAALLVEYQCVTAEEFIRAKEQARAAMQGLNLLISPDFTEEATQQLKLWKIRKGLFPSIGGARPPGTSVMIEDITFPLPRMADGVTDLQHLFDRFGFHEAIIFGHAKDGNLHFVITPSLNDTASIDRYDGFMRALVDLVANQYGGALKAEHGTGRNVAPFVADEWGTDAYQIMQDIKALFDPEHLLNPGVIINPDERAHIQHLKPLPVVEEEVDRCMECGFCESRCPSRRLTLTPRQRIVLRREELYLQETGSDPVGLDSIRNGYRYYGMDTCAADGLCGSACPVEINTGDLIKRLRTEALSDNAQAQALSLARHFNWLEGGMRTAVGAGHLVEAITGPDFVTGISKVGESLTGRKLFKWNEAVPRAILPRLPKTTRENAAAVYFPSCITRAMGSADQPGQRTLIETLLVLAERAGVAIWIPEESPGHCCGMPFSSKGYTKAFNHTLHQTLQEFWEWSDHGRLPVVIDSSSCAYTLKAEPNSLTPEDQSIWHQLKLLDAIEFVHDHLLASLPVKQMPSSVILHPNCGARKQNLDSKLVKIAQACAQSVTVPRHLDCCGFAGDRGLLFPELTHAATELEANEVLEKSYDGYYSTNLTCEIGMRLATHKPYRSFMYLVEEATR